jgi:hypothetical protein
MAMVASFHDLPPTLRHGGFAKLRTSWVLAHGRWASREAPWQSARTPQKLFGKFDPVGVHIENPLFRHPFDKFPHLVADPELFFREQVIKHRNLLCGHS